ncbi:integrase (endogenous virus) [Pseudomonas phage phiAH14a]|uniref:Integrase n=1 Tax=Pseudomonas phage phiAH14a TaxID=1805958 RepID=A0A1B0VP19_9CAUD|nr:MULTISPECIES: tyrosine-type recombinase/integrase [unclassified Pseudomonas]YP_010773018.1 integrase [Pseudomonas phage phiAH14a]AMW64461.1 integrase [Pseudomonas phage phiAH14a]KAA0946706.1 tyrosine-type recombinase/integrase [Pseudomonas sp. ANT_H4]KAA0953193.1 tyrosine-type recombinase/integrase [Pseudomonas sp. ANT_H14]
MRPRKKDRHLPACMYEKHGAYYLVRKGKWKRLGTDFQASLAEYAKLLDKGSQGGMPKLIDDALEYMRTRTKPPLKPNTLKQYESACERLKENFADFEPREVLQRHVVALKLHMADTPNMSNRIISVLRAVFTYALEQQIVDSNPCIGVRRHLEHKRDRYITHGEFQAICANSSDNMRVIYEMCYLTGQRIGDVLAIRLADIGAEGIAFKQEKTSARLLVQMTPDLEALIARVKALPRKIRGLTLFCSPRGGKPVNYSSVKDAFAISCRKAGVEDASLHDLRAKSLSDTDDQGNDAQKLGGHTDAKMTQRYLRLRKVNVGLPPTMPKKSL